MTNNQPTPRSDLQAKWTAFLSGDISADEARIWAQDLLTDYGDEEVVHDGAQRLNDHTLAGTPATAEATASYLAWQQIVRAYDADPVKWNRAYWSDQLEGSISGRSPESVRRLARSFSGALDEDTIRKVVEIEMKSRGDS